MAIIKATKPDTENLGNILGGVFRDHPQYRYMIDDPERRHRMANWVNQRVVAYGLMYGTVFTNENKAGASIIVPASSGALSMWKLIRLGLLQAPLKLGWSGFRKFLKFSSQVEEARKLHMKGDHYIQTAIGVEPEAQGKHLGSDLLQAGIELAESAGQDAYASTVLEDSVGWHDLRGYKVVGETDIPNVGTLWSMVRKAGS